MVNFLEQCYSKTVNKWYDCIGHYMHLSPGIGIFMTLYRIQKLQDIGWATCRPVCQWWKCSTQLQVPVEADKCWWIMRAGTRDCQRRCERKHGIADAPVWRTVERQQVSITSQPQQLPTHQQPIKYDDDKDDDSNHRGYCDNHYDKPDELSALSETLLYHSMILPTTLIISSTIRRNLVISSHSHGWTC